MDQIFTRQAFIIITIALIVGVMGLFFILRDRADDSAANVDNIFKMLEDDQVSGEIVKKYISEGELTITVRDPLGIAIANPATAVKDESLFTYVKTYDVDGQLTAIVFDQVDQSR